MAEQETLLPLKGTDSNVEPADPVDTKRSRTVRAFAAISVGVILKNKPLEGSCGGMANLEEGASCQICGRTNTGGCEN